MKLFLGKYDDGCENVEADSRQQKADRMPHIFLCSHCSHFPYCLSTPPTGNKQTDRQIR